jgi:hypothetical protein
MALGKRRRIEPASAGDTHNVLAAVDLGASNDSDVEATLSIGDRIAAWTQVLTAAGVGQTESAFTSCADHSVVRVAVEYATGTAAATREFLVGLRSYTGTGATYVGPFEPSNLGTQLNLLTAGRYNGVGFDRIDIRGFKEFSIVCLAKTSGVVCDVWVGVA